MMPTGARSFLWMVSVSFVLGGCAASDGDGTDTDETDVETDDTDETDAETDGTTDTLDTDDCVIDVVNDGATFERQMSTDALPTALGGEVVSGHYTKTGEIIYEEATNGGDGTMKHGAVDIDADEGTFVFSDVNENTTADFRANATFTTEGTVFTLTLLCPQEGTMVRAYTFADDVLTIYDDANNNASIFTRVP